MPKKQWLCFLLPRAVGSSPGARQSSCGLLLNDHSQPQAAEEQGWDLNPPTLELQGPQSSPSTGSLLASAGPRWPEKAALVALAGLGHLSWWPRSVLELNGSRGHKIDRDLVGIQNQKRKMGPSDVGQVLRGPSSHCPHISSLPSFPSPAHLPTFPWALHGCCSPAGCRSCLSSLLANPGLSSSGPSSLCCCCNHWALSVSPPQIPRGRACTQCSVWAEIYPQGHLKGLVTCSLGAYLGPVPETPTMGGGAGKVDWHHVVPSVVQGCPL